MLLTHSEFGRRFVFKVGFAGPADDPEISFGYAICREVNHETGEVIEEYNPKIGKRMAAIRHAERRVCLGGNALLRATMDAAVAGHKVTVKDILTTACMDRLRHLPREEDGVYSRVVSELSEQESSRTKEQEIAAWYQYEREEESARRLADDEAQDEEYFARMDEEELARSNMDNWY
jgi:hypothetical protein